MLILKEAQQIIDFCESLELDDGSIVLALEDAIEAVKERSK